MNSMMHIWLDEHCSGYVCEDFAYNTYPLDDVALQTDTYIDIWNKIYFPISGSSPKSTCF